MTVENMVEETSTVDEKSNHDLQLSWPLVMVFVGSQPQVRITALLELTC